MYVSYFFEKKGFDISCKLSTEKTICMKCQSLFSGKNKKRYFKMLPVDFFPSMLNVKVRTLQRKFSYK